METPQELRTADRRGALVRRYEYDEGSVITADFGPAGALSVDIVDDTAIIVIDDEQVEFELPDDAGEVSVNNGVFTIEE